MPPIRNTNMTKAEREEARKNSLAERKASRQYPWAITHESHPCIRAGKDQCLTCGKFGHRRPCDDPDRFTNPAPDFEYWRYVADGRLYSVDMLRMTPQELEAVDPVEAPLTLSHEDVAILDAIEKDAASKITASKGQTSSSHVQPMGAQEPTHRRDDDSMDLDVPHAHIDSLANQKATNHRAHHNLGSGRMWALHGNRRASTMLSGWHKY